MKIKICGITNEVEIFNLDALGIEFGGLWYNIPKGKYNLTENRFRSLTCIKTKTLKYIWVTFENSFQNIKNMIQSNPIFGIQLHGFQLPSIVKNINYEFKESITIFKVIHIQNNYCLEEELINRYVDAGVDFFILDTYLSKEKIGSTGVPLCHETLNQLIPFKIDNMMAMIAGGINEHNIHQIYSSYNPYGVDIDSSARKNGRINKDRISILLNNLNKYHEKQ